MVKDFTRLAMRILLHICCAPCAIMPVELLRAEGHELMGLFFNPNIQPYTELVRRRDTLASWAEQEKLRLIMQDDYDLDAWLRQMAFRESMRCNICYHQRLTRTAQVAKKGGFDAICSTLLYSVQQKHDVIRQTAEATAKKYGLKLLYRDFRPHWKAGIERSLELGLYRQPYCGCIYSERDRYYKGARKKTKAPKVQVER
jgi:predicted adenine nucleotide alpha hydrolase (AANH) superfamily ATPase